jgi:hypothetical protein
MGQIYAKYREKTVLFNQYIDQDDIRYYKMRDVYPPRRTIESEFFRDIGVDQSSLLNNECAKKLEDILVRHAYNPRLCELYITCDSNMYGEKTCNIYNVSKILYDSAFMNSIWKTVRVDGHIYLDNKKLNSFLRYPNELTKEALTGILQKKMDNIIADAEYFEKKIAHADCFDNEYGQTECNLYVLSKCAVDAMFKENTKPKIQIESIKPIENNAIIMTTTTTVEKGPVEFSSTTKLISSSYLAGVASIILLGIFGNK